VDEQRLSDVLGSDADGWELQVKDLGLQVSCKTVFVVEYVSCWLFFFVFVIGLSSSKLGYPLVLRLCLSLS
jgi:hypothetical protein